MPDDLPTIPEPRDNQPDKATPSGEGSQIFGGSIRVDRGDFVSGDKTVGYTAEQVGGLLDTAISAAREQAPIVLPPTFDELEAHFKLVVKEFRDGRAVPFLGFGVNLCGRPAGAQWQSEHLLPSGPELAEYLADTFNYPAPNRQDLIRVAQYVAVTVGGAELYDHLHPLFNADYAPTLLHTWLATTPSVLRAKGYSQPNLLIVTTNYDDLLERTFKEVGEPFDVITYIWDEAKQRGKFKHWPHGSEPRVIDTPNEYDDLPIEMPSCRLQRSIILKLHGAVDRADADNDSYVITEDHYINYLAHNDVSNPIPSRLAAKLKRAHFLFMGYSLRDWNLRVFLQRIWREQQRDYANWAVQPNAEALDADFWKYRNVKFLSVRLEEYVAKLATRLKELPPVGERP